MSREGVLLRRRRRTGVDRGAEPQAGEPRANGRAPADRGGGGGHGLPVLPDDDDRRHYRAREEPRGQGVRPGGTGSPRALRGSELRVEGIKGSREEGQLTRTLNLNVDLL